MTTVRITAEEFYENVIDFGGHPEESTFLQNFTRRYKYAILPRDMKYLINVYYNDPVINKKLRDRYTALVKYHTWIVRRRYQQMAGRRYLTKNGRLIYVKTIFIGSSFIAQSTSAKPGYAPLFIDGVSKWKTEEEAQIALDRYARHTRLLHHLTSLLGICVTWHGRTDRPGINTRRIHRPAHPNIR